MLGFYILVRNIRQNIYTQIFSNDIFEILNTAIFLGDDFIKK